MTNEENGLQRLNALPEGTAEAELLACCGSKEWARRMARRRPFRDRDHVIEAGETTWRSLSEADWLEAFRAHPRIGARASGRSAEEQFGARNASREVLEALARANQAYEERFGHIFIVCATGKSAPEMLALCQERLHNDPVAELAVAAEEQRKITQLRLAELLKS